MDALDRSLALRLAVASNRRFLREMEGFGGRA